VIHPFVGDFLNNEVDVGRKYDKVDFPDAESKALHHHGGSLSYTMGDFVETY